MHASDLETESENLNISHKLQINLSVKNIHEHTCMLLTSHCILKPRYKTPFYGNKLKIIKNVC